MKKNFNRSLMLTAAVMTLGAAAAYGQDTLIANIPFSFRISGAELPAGKYAIARHGVGSGVMELRGLTSNQSKFLMVRNSVDEYKSGGARLIFRCGEETGCALATAWTDRGRGWEFPTPKLTAAEKERVAVVYLERYAGQ